MSEPAVAPTEAIPAPPSRAAARQLWVERLARFSASGLRPAAFCAAEGVSLPSFYSWKRRLNTEARSPDAEQNSDPQPGPRLLPVRLAPAAAAVELVLPSGAVLRVPPGCDLAFVRALVAALGDEPC
jgi:transposase